MLIGRKLFSMRAWNTHHFYTAHSTVIFCCCFLFIHWPMKSSIRFSEFSSRSKHSTLPGIWTDMLSNSFKSISVFISAWKHRRHILFLKCTCFQTMDSCDRHSSQYRQKQKLVIFKTFNKNLNPLFKIICMELY